MPRHLQRLLVVWLALGVAWVPPTQAGRLASTAEVGELFECDYAATGPAGPPGLTVTLTRPGGLGAEARRYNGLGQLVRTELGDTVINLAYNPFGACRRGSRRALCDHPAVSPRRPPQAMLKHRRGWATPESPLGGVQREARRYSDRLPRLVTSIDGGGVTETRTYDLAPHRVQQIVLSTGGAPTVTLDYVYQVDNARNGGPSPALSITRTAGGVAETTEHWFDSQWRMTKVAYGESSSHSYALRADGLRTDEVVDDLGNPPNTSTISSQYGEFDQLRSIGIDVAGTGGVTVRNVETDAFGRIKSRWVGNEEHLYTWDAAGRLLEVNRVEPAGPATNLMRARYNWRDQRTDRWAAGQYERSVWDAEGLVARAEAGNVLPGAAPGVGGAGALAWQPLVRRAGLVLGIGGTRYGHDHLGSPVLAATGNQVSLPRFDAWGGYRFDTGPPADSLGALGFTGHWSDANTGLVYAQARYLAPELGAFVSPDPWSGDLGDPRSLGRFHYGFSNPSVYWDPDGRRPDAPWADSNEDSREGRDATRRATNEAFQALADGFNPCSPFGNPGNAPQLFGSSREGYCSAAKALFDPATSVGGRFVAFSQMAANAPGVFFASFPNALMRSGDRYGDSLALGDQAEAMGDFEAADSYRWDALWAGSGAAVETALFLAAVKGPSPRSLPQGRPSGVAWTGAVRAGGEGSLAGEAAGTGVSRAGVSAEAAASSAVEGGVAAVGKSPVSKGGAGGGWKTINEVPGGAVAQHTSTSCGAACGEMISGIEQSTLIRAAGAPTDSATLARALGLKQAN